MGNRDEVDLGRFGLPVFFVIGCGLLGASFAAFSNEETTRGASFSYVQPDSSTFSVWSVIYLLAFVFVGCSALVPSLQDQPGLREARLWMSLNYVSNGGWLLANGAANAGVSYWLACFVLFINLLSLVQTYRALSIDYSGPASLKAKTLLFLPVSVNIAWVFLAANVNLASVLYDPNSTRITVIGGPDYAIGIVAVAGLLAHFLAASRLDIGYASVTIWAIMGIRRNQIDPEENFGPGDKELEITCAVAAGIIALGIVFGLALFAKGKLRERREGPKEDSGPSLAGSASA